ncbi:flagellar hook-length control protein FliK [Rheinheimera sp.]|uniref:flagellar hook-length control protein FliK n=1 Tax=Rheinheimera sp. TaxID=1869214 RepID=UPI00307DA57D
MTDLMITALMGRDNALNPAKSAKALVADDSDSRFSDELAQQVQAANSVTEQKRKRQSLAAAQAEKTSGSNINTKKAAASSTSEPNLVSDEAEINADKLTLPVKNQPLPKTHDLTIPEAQPAFASDSVAQDKGEMGSQLGTALVVEDEPTAPEQHSKIPGTAPTEFELLKYLDNAILLSKTLQNQASSGGNATETAHSDPEMSADLLQFLDRQGDEVKEKLDGDFTLAAAKNVAQDKEQTLAAAKQSLVELAEKEIKQKVTKTVAEQRQQKAADAVQPSDAVQLTVGTEGVAQDKLISAAALLNTGAGQKTSAAMVAKGTTNENNDTEAAVSLSSSADGVFTETAMTDSQALMGTEMTLIEATTPTSSETQTTTDVPEAALSVAEQTAEVTESSNPPLAQQLQSDSVAFVHAEPSKADKTSNSALEPEQKVNAERSAEHGEVLMSSEQQTDTQQEQQGQQQTLPQQSAEASIRPERMVLQQSFQQELKEAIAQEKVVQGQELNQRLNPQAQRQADLLGQKLNLIQPEASAQLKEQVMLMVRDKVQTAEIRLDPAELGSMQVKISMQQDQMSVQFVVQNGQTRDLMEQQMPRLRDLLQQQGIELSQGSVQQDSSSGRQASDGSGQGQNGRSATAGHGLGGEDDLTAVQVQVAVSDRVVDYYA